MWIVYGTRTHTERVPDGLRVERACESCGETATFYERRVAHSFTLYTIPVFDTRSERVLACGACGALVRTDEHGAADLQTRTAWEQALSQAGEAMEHAGEAVAPVARSAARAAAGLFESVADAISPAMRRAGAGIGDALTRLRGDFAGGSDETASEPESSDADEPDEDVYDPEKADLLRRFAELEKKQQKP